MNSCKLHYQQKGLAALLVSIVLLLAVTLVVIFASRVAILDQKTSGNEYRHKQAFAKAEAGLEQAAAFLRANKRLYQENDTAGWVSCAGHAVKFPCDTENAEWVYGNILADEITTKVEHVIAIDGTISHLVKTSDSRVLAIGVGTSDDETAEAVAEVAYGIANILTPGQVPPLMAPLGDLGGSFTIVPNPNGGGPGVPISVWSKNITSGPGVGSWQTCDHGDFRDNAGNICMDTKSNGSQRDWGGCSCASTRSTPTDIREDIVFDVDNFPESPFNFIFGSPVTTIKAIAETSGLLLPNCDNLASQFNSLVGSALVWIEGSCEPPSNTVIGNRDKPIILVVEGNTKINANTELWGLVFGLGASMNLNGGPVIHGSVVAEVATDLTNGSYKQVYDESVFQNLVDDDINTQLTKLAYSWRDFRP